MDYLLGIDVGTSSVKVLLVDETGKVIASSSENYTVYSPYPGWAEQNPEDWWKATIRSIRKVITGTQVSPYQIQGIGISGQTHGTVVLNKDLFPLRNAIIWMDRRSTSQVEKLKKKFGEEMSSITGLPISCGFMAPSLLWIRENEVFLWDKIYKVLLPKDYIRLRLTGCIATDVTDAGGTLFLNTTRREWSEKIIEELQIPHTLFPPLYESHQLTGKVNKKAAEQTLLTEGIPVFAGGADQVMMAVGSGVIKPGDIACSIGTGALLIAYTSSPILKPEKVLHTIPYAIPQTWILMGAILSGGLCLNWFLNQVILEQTGKKLNFNSLFKGLPLRSAASKGLLFLPYLDGERTPHLDPQARGAFVGINLSHSQKDLIRAVMEGVIFALRDSLEEFKQLGIEPSCMISSGGGAKNRIWRQIQADIFNLPILTTSTEEASAYGASLMAAVGAGIFSTVKDACKKWIKIKDKVTPDPDNTKIYEIAYQVYRGLYGKLKDDFHILSQLQG